MDLATKTFPFYVCTLPVAVESFSVVICLLIVVQEFESNGSHDVETNRTTGCLKAKMKFPAQGAFRD